MNAEQLAQLKSAAMKAVSGPSAIEEIRKRIWSEYRHVPQPDFSVMLTDLKTLLGEYNIASEFWQSAEKELDEIRACDKCDLCKDHHAHH